MKYDDAAKCYNAMGELFADAIVTGRKISIERVLAIHPVKRKARKVTMGCHGTKQTIYLSDRLGFKVKVFRRFMEKHDLKWQL